MRLDALPPRCWARVSAMGCASGTLQRLRELGLTEGSRILCLGRSPLGEPGAYLIRGTAFVLRAQDSHEIQVERLGEG